MVKSIYIFFLILMGVAYAADAQTALSGKWKETSRSDRNGKYLSFKDTIHIDFLLGQEYTWMKKGGFIYRGTYKLEHGRLDLGSRVFTLVEHTSGKIVLRDQEATYEFAPYQELPRETIEQETYPGSVSSMRGLDGYWSVFKRTSATTQKEIDYTTLVKSLMLYENPDANGHIGYVSGGKDSKENPSWHIEKFENSILYCNGKTPRLFEVLKADKKELVIKEGEITYFLKRFRQ